MIVNIMQNHPPHSPCSPHLPQQQKKEVWNHRPFHLNHSMFPPNSPMVSPKNRIGPCDQNKEKRSRQQQRRNPRSPQTNHHNRRGRVRPREKGIKVIPSSVPSIPSPEPIITGPSAGSRRRRVSTDGSPRDNDVVCLTVSCPNRPKGIVAIQPGSTHRGNLRFRSMVRNYAHSQDCSSDENQKRMARSIAAELQSKGGRFLVWVKENPALRRHKNNGSWQTVGTTDALNVTRYVLLKQIEQIESESARVGVQEKSPIVASVQKRPSIPKAPEVNHDVKGKELYESDYSNATSGSSSAATIRNIFNEIRLDGEEDDLDLWSISSGGDSKTSKNTKPQLEAGCWEYKLLLPLELE